MRRDDLQETARLDALSDFADTFEPGAFSTAVVAHRVWRGRRLSRGGHPELVAGELIWAREKMREWAAAGRINRYGFLRLAPGRLEPYTLAKLRAMLPHLKARELRSTLKYLTARE